MKFPLAPKANNKDSIIGAVGAALGMAIYTGRLDLDELRRL